MELTFSPRCARVSRKRVSPSASLGGMACLQNNGGWNMEKSEVINLLPRCQAGDAEAQEALVLAV